MKPMIKGKWIMSVVAGITITINIATEKEIRLTSMDKRMLNEKMNEGEKRNSRRKRLRKGSREGTKRNVEYIPNRKKNIINNKSQWKRKIRERLRKSLNQTSYKPVTSPPTLKRRRASLDSKGL